MLAKQEAEKLEDARIMDEWKKKQEEKNKQPSAMDSMIEKIRSFKNKMDDDDITESGISSSMASAVKKQPEESYTSDDFEDVSMSASISGSKPLSDKLNWAQKIKDNAKSTESLRSSTSALSSSRQKSALTDSYGKDSSQKDSSARDSSDVADSSGKYDEDFESLSKS